MIKKIIAIVLAFTIILSLASCSKTNNAGGDGVITPAPKDGKLELTILLSSRDYSELSTNSWLADYIARFKQDFGVDIKFEEIKQKNNTQESYDEYIKKLFVKLIEKDGPELIYSHSINMESLIEQGAVVDLRDKVANIDKIYDSLLSDKVYYAPLGVDYIGMKISRAALAELKIEEPVMNWTAEDFYAARNKWTENNKIIFSAYEYSMIFGQFLDLVSLYDAQEKKVILNTPEVRQKINNLRSYIFGGSYQLIDGYKYENYYNMLYENESEERKNSMEITSNVLNNGHLDGGGVNNLFRAKSLQEWVEEFAIIRDSRNMSRRELLDSYGFLVNKNGKHLDIAYEFVNGLLSNEAQMAMFKFENDYFSQYPVNKEIEADILKLEEEKGLDSRAIQIKALALQELKDGKCSLWNTEKLDIYELEGMMKQDLTKFILADNPYSDEQLQVELKKLEDKYNIYLNE